ncbi:MAG: aldo/keto reductase, partial [Ruminiclostridium sp.]|nr:aldo/keto reductase [Ruminiclostridium sp.]
MTLQDTCTLRNGVTIPRLGFGTYKTPEGEVVETSVLAALEAGYRHIDTAAFYGNEVGVGRAIRKSGIPREEIFVTTKVWNTERGYEKAKASILASLDRLGLDYVDLCLIHWPAIPKQFDNWEEINLDTWRAFTELHRLGKVRAIGVSNFKPRHLEALMKTEVKPMVNQIECHPGQPQKETIAYCQTNGILVEAWSPMGRGKLLDHPLLVEMAGKYGVSVAQLCIRWCLQRGIVPLPKSVTPDRIRENARVY